MEERNSKKPLLITLAVLAGIIVATVAVTLIMRGRGGARFTGGDVPYPYSWTEKDNGTIALTVETGGAANGEWSVGSTEGAAVEIDVGKTKGGKTAATLSPAEQGREMVTFSLMSDEERLAELSFTVTVAGEDGKLKATVTAHRERAFQGVVHGGEETGHPFTVRGGDDGLTIFVEESEGYTDSGTAWESESTDTMAAYVSEINVSDEGVMIHLGPRAAGSAEVRVYNVTENLSFVFDVEVSGGEMLLVDSRTEPYTTEEDVEEETGETESEAQP